MLEKLLQELITAINANTVALGGKAAESEVEPETAAAPAAGKKRKKPAAPAATLEQVREALLALNEVKGKTAVVEVLARFGVGKIGDLDAANYAEAIKDANDAAAAEDEDGDDDGELFE